MEDQLMRISRAEWEGMKATIELLQDKDMMNQLIESEKNIEDGNIKKFEF